MRRGALVPEEVLTEMMAKRLCDPSTARGDILDGFPRTIQQALWLDEHLAVHCWWRKMQEAPLLAALQSKGVPAELKG
jgi:adenylate kinase family enzyme